MKQIVCDHPGLLASVDAQMPEAGPGEVIVRIKRVGICGTDMHAYHGNQPYFTYPRVLGHELAGVIKSFGVGDHSGFAVGDRVTVIPYLHCGQCGACRRGRTNCCTQMQVMGVHRDGGMAEFLAVPTSHLMAIGQLARLTDGEYPLFVLDATGNAKSMAASVQYVSHGGTLVYVGLVKGDVSLSDSEFHKRELALLSSRNATREDFVAVRTAIEEGVVDVSQYVTQRIAEDEVVDAFDSLTQPEAGVIKAVIEWNGLSRDCARRRVRERHGARGRTGTRWPGGGNVGDRQWRRGASGRPCA